MEETIIWFIYIIHNGCYVGWFYKRITKTLIVDVGKIHVYDSDEVQINIILLSINLNFHKHSNTATNYNRASTFELTNALMFFA